jgi:hypothetical protein
MKAGDRITIHSGKIFSEAIVASICNVDQLPDLPGFAAAEVREAIQSGGNFTRMALIEYDFFGEAIAVAAFEDTHGQWWDLTGHSLIIEPRTAENCAAKPPASEHRLRIVRRGIDWSKF